MIEERAHALRQSAITLFPTEAARRCHPERARGTRASEGSAGARSFAPAALRMTRLARFGARKRGEHTPMQDCARACRGMIPVATSSGATLAGHAHLLRVHHGESLAGVIGGRHQRPRAARV